MDINQPQTTNPESHHQSPQKDSQQPE